MPLPRALLAAWLVLALLLAGCTGLPTVPVDRPIATMRIAPPDAPLARAVDGSGIPPGRSAFRGLPQAEFALDARLALIRHARTGIDVQTFELGNDGVGRLLLRALRDAADRGVRVRLLLDDFHTLGLDDLLLGLATHANAEVRLFNPFMQGRRSAAGRAWNLLTDGLRLNHRMHNKLFIVDGVLAVAGGRNLADAYFMRDPQANFVDLDFLIGGALVPWLGAEFDRYWASDRVLALAQVSADTLTPAARRAAFDAALADTPPPPAPAGVDMLGLPPVSATLDTGPLPWRLADARVYADTPDKAAGAQAAAQAGPGPTAEPPTTLDWLAAQARHARQELWMVSPYFLPDAATRERLHEAGARGVALRLVTNSVGSSDEPLVAFASRRWRRELLEHGLRLYQLEPRPATHTPFNAPLHPGAATRLHAKVGVIDRRTLLVGSINLDPRSHHINTEIAIAIDSPELAGEVARQFDTLVATDLVHEVVPQPGGLLRWRLRHAKPAAAPGASRTEADEVWRDEEPGLDAWSRLRLQLLSLVVPDELL